MESSRRWHWESIRTSRSTRRGHGTKLHVRFSRTASILARKSESMAVTYGLRRALRARQDRPSPKGCTKLLASSVHLRAARRRPATSRAGSTTARAFARSLKSSGASSLSAGLRFSTTARILRAPRFPTDANQTRQIVSHRTRRPSESWRWADGLGAFSRWRQVPRGSRDPSSNVA